MEEHVKQEKRLFKEYEELIQEKELKYGSSE